MDGLITLHHHNTTTLECATGYKSDTLSDLINKKKRPQMKTILAVCIVMGVTFDNTQKALMLAGHTFRAGDDLHLLYKALALHHSGSTLADCNAHLKSKGARDCDLLGPKSKNEN